MAMAPARTHTLPTAATDMRIIGADTVMAAITDIAAEADRAGGCSITGTSAFSFSPCWPRPRATVTN